MRKKNRTKKKCLIYSVILSAFLALLLYAMIGALMDGMKLQLVEWALIALIALACVIWWKRFFTFDKTQKVRPQGKKLKKLN